MLSRYIEIRLQISKRNKCVSRIIKNLISIIMQKWVFYQSCLTRNYISNSIFIDFFYYILH